MFYKNLRLFVWLCIIFGIGKTSISSSGSFHKNTIFIKVWHLLVVIAIITYFFLTINGFNDFNVKKDLEKISSANDVVINICIVFTSFLTGDKLYIVLYNTVNDTINALKLSNKAVKLITIKIKIYLFLITVAYVILIAGEIIISTPPFIFLTRIPFCFAILHLSLHLYIILAILNLVNQTLSGMLISNNIEATTEFLTRTKGLRYVLNPDVRFINDEYNQSVDIKFLCKTYDNLVTIMLMLQNIHSIQILLSIWLMFSNAVTAVTLIACHQANPQWLVIAKGITLFVWCSMGCYIEDKLFKGTEQTEILIMKCIIDYRCDVQKKNILENFKQLVNTNRLQFSACNLFELNYSMILGTVVNVITYSIILIQLFLN